MVGRPPDAIVSVARERHADLIVMGARGHGPLDSLMFGSTSQHVVRHASAPVLTVRAAS
jgi:nucleotide-binding universal stress UspA family protein